MDPSLAAGGSSMPDSQHLEGTGQQEGSQELAQGGSGGGLELQPGGPISNGAGEPGAHPLLATQRPADAAATESKRATICFDFTKNQCTRGAACKFSHDVGLIITVNSQEKGICFDFLKGLCTRGLLCRFSHDLRNLQTPQCTASSAKKRFAPICYDFVKNQCTRGEDCKYSHDYSSILYGPRAPGKDPYVICVDFTRGKCMRGASCRYTHVDPRMLSTSGGLVNPSGPVHPALLAAGLGAAVAAQSSTLAGAGAIQGALAGLNAANLAAPSRQPSDLQAQAALLLSGLGGSGLMGTAGLPGTPVAGGAIPAAWSGLPGVQQGTGLQQSPEIAALLEQLQRTALSDSLAQLSPTAGDATSLNAAALNALMAASGNVSPSYAGGLGGLVGMMDPQQAQQQAQGLYGQGPSAAAAAAAMLQSQLSDVSQLSALAGSAPVSAAPTPTAAGAGAVPTVFQQHRPMAPSGAEGLDGGAPSAATGCNGMPKPQQQLMQVYHPLLPGKGAGAGLRADIMVDARATGSPTIAASWGSSQQQQQQALGGQQMQQQQQQPASMLGQQLKAVAAGLPPAPPPVHVAPPGAGLGEQQQGSGTPTELASSYEQMQMIWGQQSIWGQRQ